MNRTERLEHVLRQILWDLPLQRDWLDPDLEKEARALILMKTIEGFTIEHDSGVVTVEKQNVAPDQFSTELSKARSLLLKFKATQRNTWGCDGIGYDKQKASGIVRVHLSYVSPQAFNKGLASSRNA